MHPVGEIIRRGGDAGHEACARDRVVRIADDPLINRSDDLFT
jgi:hypothetical protein